MLTLACTLSFWAAGMDIFDAVCHAFSTVAIGGFSTHDDSIGFFQSPVIVVVTIIFMLISGVNFALHFVTWRDRSIKHYFFDAECRFYLWCVLSGIIVTVSYLYFTKTYRFQQSLLHGAFELVSLLTTTGFAVDDYALWPGFLPSMLFLFAFMGGCGGSTAGGIKVIRTMLICKQGLREIYRLIHPNAVIPIKIGQNPVPDRIVESVWGFFAVYMLSFIAMFLILLGTGLDFVTAFSAVGACINNLGPGMGEVSSHYAAINDTAKWVLAFAMLLGRLEVFTLLVLFTPAFWRH
jgi:trk system potassium uptake protein TrkH